MKRNIMIRNRSNSPVPSAVDDKMLIMHQKRTTALRPLLEKVRSETIVGIGIRNSLASGMSTQELARELRELGIDNPGIMKQIVGPEILKMLKIPEKKSKRA